MREKPIRSIVKAISFRIIATLVTITIIYFFTREVALSIGVGIFEIITKLFFYYFHERAWEHIGWGLKKS